MNVRIRDRKRITELKTINLGNSLAKILTVNFRRSFIMECVPYLMTAYDIYDTVCAIIYGTSNIPLITENIAISKRTLPWKEDFRR